MDAGKIPRERNIMVVTLVCCVVFYLVSPRFLSLDNMSAISRQVVPIGGVLWGIAFIGIVNNALSLLNVEDVWHQVFNGVVILTALGVNWLLWQSRQAEAH